MSSCQGRTTLGFYVKESVLKHLAYLFESVFRYIKVGFYRRIFLWVLWIFLTSFSKQHLMNSCLCLSLGVRLKYLHLIKQSKKTELIYFLDLWSQMHVRHFSLILLRGAHFEMFGAQAVFVVYKNFLRNFQWAISVNVISTPA